MFFDRYSAGGTANTPADWGPGDAQVELPDGTVVGIRYESGEGDPAVTINNDFGYWRVHFGF